MPWIRETSPQDADLGILAGTSICRRYWDDNETGAMAEWHPVDSVARDESGRITVGTHHYTERGGRKPHRREVCINPDDVLAYIMREGEPHESRLYLDNGYLVARPGENLKKWDAHRGDGMLIREGVTVVEGRKLIA